MKKVLISCILAFTVTCASAAEKKAYKDIDSDEFTTDTMVNLKGAGDEHVAIVWWIPIEFWESILARDTTTSEADKKSILDTMSNVSLLAIAQADITTMGAFRFYSQKEVKQSLHISYTDADGKTKTLSTMKTTDPDLEVLLAAFKPILGAAMGNLGNNMHFYVLDDKSKASLRVLDPYKEGALKINLKKRNGDLMTGSVEMPLNTLFVPRKCPNGKNAHISWDFCPWTGKKLPK